MAIDGTIGADGRALLVVNGLTNDPGYVIGRLPVGSPYRYDVTARFEATHGTGTRLTGRPCALEFARQ